MKVNGPSVPSLPGATPSPTALPKSGIPGQKPGQKIDPWGGLADRMIKTVSLTHPDATHEQLDRLNSWAAETCDRAASENVAGVEGRTVRPGAASGVFASTLEQAEELRADGKPYILYLEELTESNLELAHGASALIVPDQRKGRLLRSVAALGRPSLAINPADLARLSAGAAITLDATSGRVLIGDIAINPGTVRPELQEGLGQLRQRYGATVVAEANTPASIAKAIGLGADGVRIDADTLMQGKRVLPYLRRYLVANEAVPRRAALEQVLTHGRAEAETLLESAGAAGSTFTLGTRAPHSFFPSRPEKLAALAPSVGLPAGVLQERVGALGGGNTKLGLRGARWGVKDPALFACIGRAVFEAYAARLEAGEPAGPLRFLIPSVGLGGEIALIRGRLEAERKAVEEDFGVSISVAYGAGVDTARGAMGAGEIAEHADFIEYGLGEMTESLFGISRDDADPYLQTLIDQDIYPSDPFVDPDIKGLGEMVRVGQYLAGSAPNSFPGALRGRQLLTANGLMLAAQCGVTELTVPVEACVTTRIRHAQLRDALDLASGLSAPRASLRDEEQKVFEILSERTFGDVGVAVPKSSIPEGVTGLEFVEDLITQVRSGALTSDQALMQVPTDLVDTLGQPVVDPSAKVTVVAKGIAAAPGCGQGRVAFSREKAEAFEKAGEPYLLMVNEVHAEEVEAVRKSQGLLSIRGGKTSHAAVTAANSSVPCVMSEKSQIDLERRTLVVGGKTIAEGDWITLDGTKGQLLAGKVPLINPSDTDAFDVLLGWADQSRRLAVMANADTPDEAIAAFAKGASGIGLVRTEHMFAGADRILAFRSTILGEPASAKVQLEKLEQMQTADFLGLFQAAKGRKVAVRLLDPPLYEYLPQRPEEIVVLAKAMGLPADEVARRISAAQEVDSLLGMRGVRLAVARPEIEAMQVRALARAYVAAKASGIEVYPLQVTVPQVGTGSEMEAASRRIRTVVAEVAAESKQEIPVQVGAMVETPRGALDAGEIAKHCEYFSYGTNDLTQTTLGYGRNVAGMFIPQLIKAGALESDPTGTLDREGVAKMMKVAEFLGRDQKGTLTTGICGAQGSDPESIRTVERLGLDYLSVSPGQVPKARLAAAQAAILVRAGAHAAVEAQASAVGFDTSREQQLLRQLSRVMAGLTQIPIPLEQQGLADQLEYLVRSTGVVLRQRMAKGPLPVGAELDLFKAYSRARSLLDQSALAGALLAEVPVVRQQASEAGVGDAANKFVVDAEAAAQAFAAAATAELSATSISSKRSREVNALALKALRALESTRELVGGARLNVRHQGGSRLWHHNDGWDNNHYTRQPPDTSQPFGTYLKRVSAEFLKDNGLSAVLAGGELIPKDRKVIYAVSHRSGAIDRFVTVAALPMDDDKFMYMVREGSPLDQIASKAYGKDNRWILASGGSQTLDDQITRVTEGFANGARTLLTYPEGTGSVAGETHPVASGTAVLALRTGAVIVPVTLEDNFRVKPQQESVVTVRVHAPIDPSAIVGTDAEVIDALKTLTQYELSRDFRTVL